MDIAANATWPKFRSLALDWLIGKTQTQPFIDNLFGELCQRLHESGLPLDRATLHLRTLHPQFAGVRMLWRPGLAEAEITPYAHGVNNLPEYARSPIRELYEGVEGVRLRVAPEPPAEGDAYGITGELRDAGITDYVALPLTFTDGKRHAATWATRQPGGFRTDDLVCVNDILPLLAMAVEIRANRRIAKNLLSTYVGRSAGERVLAGQITRGSGETVRAAIWQCDMRTFTAISERWPRDDVILRLNEYFDAMGAPVERHGGEILKFIGDGMLAVFPLEDEDACHRALLAALDARRAITTLNERYVSQGQEKLRYGLALHIGDVMYGNIGTTTRLDFTVIGPAVNTASRLEGLTKQLGRKILLSAPFAMRCGCGAEMLVDLGRYPLRGVGEPLGVFGLADE